MDNTVNIQDTLSDLEVSKIEAFCKDKEMHQAVRKVLLAGIYFHGTLPKGATPDPLMNGAFSLAALSVNNPIKDEQLGANIRGIWAGINALKNAFDTLESVKAEVEADLVEVNEAI